MTANTCPHCTATELCQPCQQAAAEYQAWADAQARLQAWLDDEATDRYNAEQWARGGTNYNDGWFTGYTVGR